MIKIVKYIDLLKMYNTTRIELETMETAFNTLSVMCSKEKISLAEEIEYYKSANKTLRKCLKEKKEIIKKLEGTKKNDKNKAIKK